MEDSSVNYHFLLDFHIYCCFLLSSSARLSCWVWWVLYQSIIYSFLLLLLRKVSRKILCSKYLLNLCLFWPTIYNFQLKEMLQIDYWLLIIWQKLIFFISTQKLRTNSYFVNKILSTKTILKELCWSEIS